MEYLKLSIKSLIKHKYILYRQKRAHNNTQKHQQEYTQIHKKHRKTSKKYIKST